jgi:hypothetical protein
MLLCNLKKIIYIMCHYYFHWNLLMKHQTNRESTPKIGMQCRVSHFIAKKVPKESTHSGCARGKRYLVSPRAQSGWRRRRWNSSQYSRPLKKIWGRGRFRLSPISSSLWGFCFEVGWVEGKGRGGALISDLRARGGVLLVPDLPEKVQCKRKKI